MKKYTSILTGLILTFMFVGEARASLLRVTKEGEVVTNVLSLTSGLALSAPDADRFEVVDISRDDEDQTIYLSKDDGGFAYLALGEGGTRYEVTNVEEDIVEIEEREEIKRLRIILQDGSFVLSQDGFNVVAENPIEIDPKTGKIMVETNSGKVFLGVLPLDAATTILRSRSITKINDAYLATDETGNVVYRFEGDKEVDLLKILNYSVPVITELSISTGEIIKVNQPIWLRILGFLET